MLDIEYYDDFFGRRFRIDFRNRVIRRICDYNGSFDYSPVFWHPVSILKSFEKERRGQTHCIFLSSSSGNEIFKIFLRRTDAYQIINDCKIYDKKLLDKIRSDSLIEKI